MRIKNLLRTLRNYYFYCGIEKEEYNALKKDAYISNFKVWKVLHFLMAAVFGMLSVASMHYGLMESNRLFYFIGFLYSAAAIALFFVLKKDSIAAQLLIYLSMSFLFLFGALISVNQPQHNATTFIVLLLVTPMFMIDKPFFMTIELGIASATFLIWMRGVKPYDVWQLDFINVITYTVVGCILNVVANSIRIKEFVLTREIRLQKDTDEMTGLHNKSSLTREINAFLAEPSTDKGLLFMLDVDRFKLINDLYGHDVGDSVIAQIGRYLAGKYTEQDVTGRFGGDEFIVFIKNTDDLEAARKIAEETAAGASEFVALPEPEQKISISIGIAAYTGREKTYSELFKKADLALYKAKADPENRISIYG